MKNRLSVSRPFDDYALDGPLVALIGRRSCDSGAGCGMRDMAWEFPIPAAAEAMAAKVRATFPGVKATVSEGIYGAQAGSGEVK